MGTAYTPGLTVSADHVVQKIRRLPLKGEVLVTEGQLVEPHTVIARTELPGILQSVKVAEKLGVEPKEVKDLLKVSIGDRVEVGQLLAESKGLFGLFKGQVFSEFEGTVEDVSEVTGNLLVREPPVPIEITAYLRGRVAEVIPEEGAVIEARGAVVQGIFGVGGERVGILRTAVASPDDVLDANAIRDDDAGKVLIGGSQVTLDAIRKAEQVGVVALVAGAVRDLDLTEYLGYDIGVAITGNEPIPLTIIATEGFGRLSMAGRTFELLRSLEGKEASVNGATQIRAGVIRPEIIVPSDSPPTGSVAADDGGGALEVGTPIRIIREPWFGKLAKVSDLPPELQVVESGAEVRVLRAVLDESGEEVTVPRANVEIIAK
jgi:putative ubiquitin-RnfH superfamily antitoxin RatB of RatAB toxin-antitoxin module